MEIPTGGSGSYTLPVASSTTLGGVKAPAATDDMTQQVGVKKDGTMWVPPSGSGLGEYAGDLLAEGTIDISNYTANTRIETGVTLAKLKEYKRIRLTFKATTNKGNGYFFIKVSNESFMRCELNGLVLDLEWANDSKTLVRMHLWIGNSSYISNAVKADITTFGQDERNTSLSIIGAMCNVSGVKETETLYFNFSSDKSDTTVTYPWWIYGVMK